MNWMTSGRKRVQRSQKIKELRAKHFAKVAADRARAVPHASRSSSTSVSRQSTDVSRLKSRWVQASQPRLTSLEHTIAATVQRPQSGSTSTKLAEDMSSPSFPPDDLRGGPNEGPFCPGMLNLDVTPPLGVVPRAYRGDIASVGKPSALSHDTAEAGSFARPFQQDQQSAPPLIAEANPTHPLQTPYPERRQLVFGGGCEEVHDSREDYEGQPLGSEDEPQGNPMRFFNSGVEIAHDGSPVSEILGTPSQPVGNVMTQLTPTGDPTVSASDAGVIEGKEAAGGRGLPRFSKGTMVGDGLPATTPSRSSRPWEAACFQGTHNEDFLSSVADLEPGLAIDLAGETYAREHEHMGCWSFEKEAREEHESAKAQFCPGVGQEHELRNEPLTPLRDQSMPAKFEALARTWGLFSGALDSTPGSTADNNAASSSNDKRSPAYHSEPQGAREEEGNGNEEGCGIEEDHGNEEGHGLEEGDRKEEGHGNVEGNEKEGDREQEQGHEREEGRGTEEGHGGVRDGSGVYSPRRVCESAANGPATLQEESPHAYESPPRSHRPGGSRRAYDQECSRSPELVMVWDDGEPLDGGKAKKTVPADQDQELQGRRQLWGSTSTSPSPVINLALEIDSSQEEQALQEGQVATNVLQRPSSSQSLPAAAVQGAHAVDKQTNLHGGALSLSPSTLTQTPTEGDGTTENNHRIAGAGPTTEAQQPQVKCENVSPLPSCDIGPLGSGGEDKGPEKVGGKHFSSSEREMAVVGVKSATPVNDLVGDACPTEGIQTFNGLESCDFPDALGSDVAEKHEAPEDKSTPDAQLEVVGKSNQPRHVPPLDKGSSQDETRKRSREMVESDSEQQCDHVREECKEESARVTGRNGKCRRQESLADPERKVGGGNRRVGTSRGRMMASMREHDEEMGLELMVDERSTITWYKTIVACWTAECRG